MRECICRQCNHKFYEDDSNPNIHYSNPSTICGHCLNYNSLSVGSWYQTSDGQYHQKGVS
jgi:hypothetical protein